MIRGSCLCGDVRWEADGELDVMTHCHCGRCRKTHGAAYATYVMGDAEAFRLVHGRERLVRYESSPGFFRPFCGRCGSVVPDGQPWEGRVFMPAGPLDDDPGVRPVAHIFVASKPPWFEIRDALPRFDAYPPGFDLTVLPDLPAPEEGGRSPRGSCLCGAVTYVIAGEPLGCHHCHCSRCRKARAAAHATNVVTRADGVRFRRGEEQLASYKVPAARFFTQVFCRTCGSPMPRVDPAWGLAFVPAGSLDEDPGIRPQRHFFTASKAPWHEIADELPQDAEAPPPP